MSRYLKGFLLFMIFYHVFHTCIIYGRGWMDVASFSLIKEIFFVLLVMIGVWKIRGQFQSFISSYQGLLFMMSVIFAIFLGISLWQDIPFDSVIVGIKYDLRWLVILLGGMILGRKPKVKDQELQHRLQQWIYRGLWMVILGGVVWQLGKVLFPGFFQRWGYGPIGDYVLGAHPPMRYRTGPGGWMRFSGILSGPNNLGYMMVAFFPFVFGNFLTSSSVSTGLLSRRNLVIAMLLTTLITFSRAAIGVVFLEIIFLLRIYKPFRRKQILSIFFFGSFGLLLLLATKRGSTIEHLSRLLQGVSVVQQFPGGLGLGMSGPSIHYHGIYLPENQYLQRAIDGGIVGCLCIIFFLFSMLYYSWKQQINKNHLFLLSLGLVGLMAIGCFLHSFEDSMVNYFFFLLLGIVMGGTGHVKSKE